MANIKGVAAGAALGTLIGCLSVIFYPRRREIFNAVVDQTSGLTDIAKNYADNIINRGRKTTGRSVAVHNYWQGGLLGFFVGSTLAIFITPKTGKQLRSQLSKTYNNIFGKTQEVVRVFRNNSHPFQLHPSIHTRKNASAKRKSKIKTS